MPDLFYFWLFANKSELIQYFTHDLYNEVYIIVHSTDDNLCSEIAKYGSVNALKCARIAGYVWNSEESNVIINSMIHGHIDCLIFAIENDCSMVFSHIQFKKTINIICEKGYLSILNYVYKNMDLFTIIIDDEYYDISDEDYNQKEQEEIEIMKINDCDYWNEVALSSSKNGHIPILQFAIDERLKIY
jgi:hypothetical protein